MNIQQQKQLEILLIGEVCQDVYVFGEVSRLSPEAPVPVLKKNDKNFKQGMSGNVLKNISSILEDNSKIDFISNKIEKIKKIRFLDQKSNYQIMRYDIEKEITPFKFEDIDKQKKYDAIIISDYDKGFLSEKEIEKICKYYNNTPIFVDTKKSDLSSYQNCILKINENEYVHAVKKHRTSEIVVTLGGKGCLYQGKIYPTEKVEVYDVCGAGDVFLSALVARWLETKDIISSIKTANKCAALSVTHLGCYTIKRKEYENLCV